MAFPPCPPPKGTASPLAPLSHSPTASRVKSVPRSPGAQPPPYSVPAPTPQLVTSKDRDRLNLLLPSSNSSILPGSLPPLRTRSQVPKERVAIPARLSSLPACHSPGPPCFSMGPSGCGWVLSELWDRHWAALATMLLVLLDISRRSAAQRHPSAGHSHAPSPAGCSAHPCLLPAPPLNWSHCPGRSRAGCSGWPVVRAAGTHGTHKHPHPGASVPRARLCSPPGPLCHGREVGWAPPPCSPAAAPAGSS